MTARRETSANLLILLVWIMASLISFPMHIDSPGFARWAEDFEKAQCSPPWGSNSSGYVWMKIILEFIIPLVVITISQVFILNIIIVSVIIVVTIF